MMPFNKEKLDAYRKIVSAEVVTRGQHPYSYIIYSGSYTGGPYFAKDSNGEIEFSGTNASYVIQSAIDALTDGGKIFIKAGLYSQTSDIIINNKNSVSIIAEKGVELRVGADLTSQIKVTGTCSNILIYGLELNGSKNSYAMSEANIYFDGTVTDSTISNCYIHDYDKVAIQLDDGCNRNKILNNRIINGNASYAGGAAIKVFRCKDLTIQDNNLQTGYDGIHVDSEYDQIARHKIIHNYIYNFSDSGIDLPDSRFCRVIDNTVEGNDVTDEGFDCDGGSDNIISFNTFRGCTARGVGTYNAHNMTISNNIIQGNKVNIDITNSDYIIIEGNQILEASDNQIWLDSSTNVKIIGNIIKDGSAFAIDGGYGSGSTAEAKFNTITGNSWGFGGGTINLTCFGNIGFVTENSGTATIASGATSVTVDHGLAGTPTVVVLGATHSEVADAVWSADATNITITVPSAVTADRDISWYAEYKP